MDTGRIKRYWGTQRVARVCQVTPGTVANWIDQGLLKGHKTPTGRRRVASADLAAFLRAHGMAVPPDLLQAEAEREKIVVVDDEPAYLRALMKMIARSDLAVDAVPVTNGVDALLEIGRLRPAVVVLDYRLPDMNADQVVERLLEPGGRASAGGGAAAQARGSADGGAEGGWVGRGGGRDSGGAAGGAPAGRGIRNTERNRRRAREAHWRSCHRNRNLR